jgi:hypothetical protein
MFSVQGQRFEGLPTTTTTSSTTTTTIPLDSDGDGEPDVTDPCPSDPTDTCDPNQTVVQVCDETGCTVQTPDGSVTITIPPGALDGPTPISITGGLTQSEFGLTRCADPNDAGCARDLILCDLLPAGLVFNVPVLVTFVWPDADDDGEVDGQPQKMVEKKLRVWQDGTVISGECQDPPHQAPGCTTACGGLTCCCDESANTWTIAVTSFSEFLLGTEILTVGVEAKKLVVLDKLLATGRAKVVFSAKEPGGAITKGAGTDLDAIAASFDVWYADGSAAGAFVLPGGVSDGTAGWTVNDASRGKYVNLDAPVGPTQARVALIKEGATLKLVGRGLGDTPFDILVAGAPTSQPVGQVVTGFCVANDGEETCHCSAFADCSYKLIAADTGAKLVCRDGTPDADCHAIGGP